MSLQSRQGEWVAIGFGESKVCRYCHVESCSLDGIDVSRRNIAEFCIAVWISILAAVNCAEAIHHEQPRLAGFVCQLLNAALTATKVAV